jgi:predicted DNA binding protein
VEFAISDGPYPFVHLSRERSCTFELAAIVPRQDARYAEFFNVVDVDPGHIAAGVSEYDDVEVSVLREYCHGGLVEFVVSDGCPAYRLAEMGALPREVTGQNGQGRIVAEVTPGHTPSDLIEQFVSEFPEASLVCKRELDAVGPLYTRSMVQQLLQERLTDRQREVLETAYEAGFYEWPRESTGEEVAAKLDIASATFAEHIAAAERKLLTATFEGPPE